MRELPIIFTGEMIRAIQDGRKTVTRRVVRPQLCVHSYEPFVSSDGLHWETHCDFHNEGDWIHRVRSPYGKPGDHLYVRETGSWVTLAENEYNPNNPAHRRHPDGYPVSMLYRADAEAEGWQLPAKWTPSIFMPKWTSRMTLENAGVRIERVQEITEDDAIREGVWDGWAYVDDPLRPEPMKDRFHELWDQLNAKRGFSWESNCWVWVIDFRKVKNEQ